MKFIKNIIFLLFLFVLNRCTYDTSKKDLYFIISEESSVIIEIDDLDKFISKYKESNYKNIIENTHYINQLNLFQKLNIKGRNSKKTSNKFISSLNITGNDSYFWVNAFYYEKKLNKERLNKFYKYQNTKIYTILENNKDYYLFYKNNLAIFSENKIAIETTLRNFNKNITETNLDLKNLLDNSLKNRDSFIIGNTKSLDKILDINLLRKYNLSNICKWVALDLDINDKEIAFSGFIDKNKKGDKYSNVVSNQNPKKSTIDKYLPSNTSYYIYKSISNIERYKDDYDYFLELNNEKGYSTKTNLDKKVYIRISEINSFFDNELILLQQSKKNNIDKINQEKTLIVKIKNNIKLTELLSEYTEKNIKKYKNFEINRFKKEIDLGETFGNISKNIRKPYYAIYKDILIISNSIINIEEIIGDNIDNKNLGSSKEYLNFVSNFRSNNIFVFVKNPIWINDMQKGVFRYNLRKFYKKNKYLEEVKYFGIELSYRYKGLLLNGLIQYQKEVKNEISNTNIKWATKLKSSVRNSISLLRNHRTKKMNYFFQDSDNNINLINHKGGIIWTKKINSKILGNPKQIDFYSNGKYQILFSTKKEIHMVDILGRNVEGFPIKAKKEITQPISLFDYDNNKKYRIAMICSKEIFMLNKECKKIEGFNFKSDYKIVSAIKYIKIKGKDYLYFVDNNEKIRVLNRKGEDRIIYKGDYKIKNIDLYFVDGKSNYFTSMDKQGRKINFYFDGTFKIFKKEKYENVKKIIVKNNSELIYFNNEIRFMNKDNFYSYDLDFKIDYIDIISLKNNNYVYFFSKEKERVYLLNEEGEIHKGFPIFGKNPIKGGDFITQRKYNIISANNNFIYCYDLL